MNHILIFPNNNGVERLPSDFKMSEIAVNWDIVHIMNLDVLTSEILATDISGIKITIDPTGDFYKNLWHLVTVPFSSLSRSFNISMSRKNWAKILKEIFNLDIDYSQLSNISFWNSFDITQTYPFPWRMNKNISHEVQEQIKAITTLPLSSYEWKSINDLLCWWLCTQTFWDFCMVCLRNWIKLNP